MADCKISCMFTEEPVIKGTIVKNGKNNIGKNHIALLICTSERFLDHKKTKRINNAYGIPAKTTENRVKINNPLIAPNLVVKTNIAEIALIK